MACKTNKGNISNCKGRLAHGVFPQSPGAVLDDNGIVVQRHKS